MAHLDKEFVYQLTDWQNRLFGYLVTLLSNPHDARDVLQETNLAISITLIFVRGTTETMLTGLVHGFASRRHPTLPAPTLAIRRALASK